MIFGVAAPTLYVPIVVIASSTKIYKNIIILLFRMSSFGLIHFFSKIMDDGRYPYTLLTHDMHILGL
jgi:hypothetical protein